MSGRIHNQLMQIFVAGLVVLTALTSPDSCFAQQSSSDGYLQNLITKCQPKLVKVYGAGAGRVEGYATGILVSADGQVLTSQGVFLDGRQVRVVLSDGTSHLATILRRDRTKQLALLKIAAETPEYFQLGAEDIGQKGDWIVALSNAFKVAEKTEPMSAMIGVISLRTYIEAKLNRRDVAYQGNLVLIDSITSNPGAAGGAVVTMDGKLVGMIGKIINSSETNTRLNYAVPNAELFNFVAGKTEAQTVTTVAKKKADLGIKLFRHGGRNAPAYIDRVIRRGPAAEAKLKPDDLIVTIAGEKVGNVRQYEDVLASLTPGEEVLIIVKRGVEMMRIPITPREKK